MIEHWLLLRLTSWRLGLAGLTAAAIATTYLTRGNRNA